MQLVLNTRGLALKKSSGCFHIKGKDKARHISPFKVSSIVISGEAVVSTSAIKLATEHEIPVLILSNTGKVEAHICSPVFRQSADFRKKQVVYSGSEESKRFVLELLHWKSQEHESNLLYFSSKSKNITASSKLISTYRSIQIDSPSYAKEMAFTTWRNKILGKEGAKARAYWKGMSLCLPDSFKFKKRSRRPALDYFNAGLNYLYGMLYNQVEIAVHARGLDSHMGFMHTTDLSGPSLVFDLIEPFRPFVDKWWFDFLIENNPAESYFIPKGSGFWLSNTAKRKLIPFFYKQLEKQFSLKGKVMKLSSLLNWIVQLYINELEKISNDSNG